MCHWPGSRTVRLTRMRHGPSQIPSAMTRSPNRSRTNRTSRRLRPSSGRRQFSFRHPRLLVHLRRCRNIGGSTALATAGCAEPAVASTAVGWASLYAATPFERRSSLLTVFLHHRERVFVPLAARIVVAEHRGRTRCASFIDAERQIRLHQPVQRFRHVARGLILLDHVAETTDRRHHARRASGNSGRSPFPYPPR